MLPIIYLLYCEYNDKFVINMKYYNIVKLINKRNISINIKNMLTSRDC